MSKNRKVRVALWGIGSHVRRNLIPAFERSSFVDLVALHTRTESALGEVARLTGAAPYRDVDRLLSTRDVDVVYIAAPTGVHASMAIATIEAGKHVWCEKPMTASYAETERVVNAALNAGLVALESDMFLHHPQFAMLQRLVKSGELGLVASMTARFGFPHRPGTDFRYSKELGGGAILDAGFYPVAAAVALLGPGLRLAGATVANREGTEVDIGGTALAVSGNRSAVLDWGFGRAYRSEIEIWCEAGVITTDRAFSKPADLATQIAVRLQGGEERVVSVVPADHFALMLDNFAAITLGEVPFDAGPTLARARLLTEIGESGLSMI